MNLENIKPVNVEALSRALIAVVGEANAKLVTEAYQAIDSAMLYGHIAGFKEGYQAAEQAYRAEDEAKYQNAEDAYDDGYVDGVGDARSCPENADRNVARLCGEDQYDDDAFDPSDDTPIYEGDSGDETSYDELPF